MEQSIAIRARRGPVVAMVGGWLLLVVLTMATWWLGADVARPGTSAIVTSVVLVVAFIKMFVIGRSFMGVGGAARPVRLGFLVWCGAACLAVVGAYLLA